MTRTARVEPLWRMNWPQELKPIPRPIQQQIDDGFWSPDTRLQAIADAREAATTEAIEWFANAGLMSDFGGFTGTDIADLMDHIYAALGIDALTKEVQRDDD